MTSQDRPTAVPAPKNTASKFQSTCGKQKRCAFITCWRCFNPVLVRLRWCPSPVGSATAAAVAAAWAAASSASILFCSTAGILTVSLFFIGDISPGAMSVVWSSWKHMLLSLTDQEDDHDPAPDRWCDDGTLDTQKRGESGGGILHSEDGGESEGVSLSTWPRMRSSC